MNRIEAWNRTEPEGRRHRFEADAVCSRGLDRRQQQRRRRRR